MEFDVKSFNLGEQSIDKSEIHLEPGNLPGMYSSREEFFKDLESHLTVLGVLMKAPILGGKEIDLYNLYHQVLGAGGSQKISASKKWKEIGTAFNFPSSCTNSSFALKTHYNRLLLSFELKRVYGIIDSTFVPAANRVRNYNTGSTQQNSNTQRKETSELFIHHMKPSPMSNITPEPVSHSPAPKVNVPKAEPPPITPQSVQSSQPTHLAQSMQLPFNFPQYRPKNDPVLHEYRPKFTFNFSSTDSLKNQKRRKIGAYDSDTTGFVRIVCSLESGLRNEVIWAVNALCYLTGNAHRHIHLKNVDGLLSAISRQFESSYQILQQRIEESSNSTSLYGGIAEQSEGCLNTLKSVDIESEEILVRISAIIRNLSFSKDNEDIIAHNHPILGVIIKLLLAGNYRIPILSRDSLDTLSAIADHIDLRNSLCHPIIPGLLQLLKRDDKVVILTVLECFSKLIVHPHNKDSFTSLPDDFYARMMELISDPSAEIQHYIIFLLFVLSTYDDTVKVMILKPKEGIKRLLGLLYNVQEEERVSLLLRNLSLCAQNRHHFIRHESFFVQVAMSKLRVSEIIGDIVCNLRDSQSTSVPINRLF